MVIETFATFFSLPRTFRRSKQTIHWVCLNPIWISLEWHFNIILCGFKLMLISSITLIADINDVFPYLTHICNLWYVKCYFALLAVINMNRLDGVGQMKLNISPFDIKFIKLSWYSSLICALKLPWCPSTVLIHWWGTINIPIDRYGTQCAFILTVMTCKLSSSELYWNIPFYMILRPFTMPFKLSDSGSSANHMKSSLFEVHHLETSLSNIKIILPFVTKKVAFSTVLTTF